MSRNKDKKQTLNVLLLLGVYFVTSCHSIIGFIVFEALIYLLRAPEIMIKKRRKKPQ